MSRRSSADPALPRAEPAPALDVSPDQRAIGAGERETELAELYDHARSLERQLEALRQQIRRMESPNPR